MLNFGISTKLYDLDGDFIITQNIDNDSAISRRVNSTATLDGSSYVSDTGYSSTDRKWKFELTDLSEAEIENLKRLFKLHSRFYLTSKEGAFEVNFEVLAPSDNGWLLNFLTVGDA